MTTPFLGRGEQEIVEFLKNIAASLIASVLAFAAGWFGATFRQFWTYRHFRGLLGGLRRVRLVLPHINVAEFNIRGVQGKAAIPSNIPLMPMPEGRAVGHLVDALALVRPRLTIEQVVDQDFNDDGTPVICIGGPSVNEVTAKLLEGWPQFGVHYPDHVARYGTTTYLPNQGPNGLTEDYGFIFQGHTLQGTPCLIFCGVWAVGTEIAIRAYAPKTRPGSENNFYRDLARSKRVFGVAHAKVDGLKVGAVRIVSVISEAS